MESEKSLWNIEELRNQIFHMDCMELFLKIPDNSVSLILTDPPYGISYQNHFTYNTYSMLQGDAGIDYGHFAKQCYRILKENSHAYFFTRFDCYPYHYQCLADAGFCIKNCLVVEKGTVGGIGDLLGSYANNAEWIIFCQKGRRVFQETTLMKNSRTGRNGKRRKVPIAEYKRRFNACWFGEKYPKATYNSTWQQKQGIYHPTIKNVDCLAWLIELSSMRGELVFDGFMGSGSTALAAKQTGRYYLGAEIEETYYNLAHDRLRACHIK